MREPVSGSVDWTRVPEDRLLTTNLQGLSREGESFAPFAQLNLAPRSEETSLSTDRAFIAADSSSPAVTFRGDG